MKINTKKPVIFCDFDGTITEHDVIQMIMAEFAPPQWKSIVSEILDARTLSIKDGIVKLFDLIPSALEPKITEFVLREVKLRKGFDEFMAYCKQNEIPFLVVSGGVDFFIRPVLAKYKNQIEIFSNLASFDAESITLSMPYLPKDCPDCNECACCKQEVMKTYSSSDYFRISIGDSLTDLGASKLADLAFARARLLDYTKAENIPVQPFDNFDDVQHHLERLMYDSAITA